MLKEGDKAPNFRATADDGSTVALEDFKGSNLVLYFYPKANTTGCTSEAIQFRDTLGDFEAANAAIVGVQRRFGGGAGEIQGEVRPEFSAARRYEFDVIEAYGARRMKSFFGKSSLGIVRSSFWIGPDGKIRKIWPKVTVKGHAADVLETRSRRAPAPSGVAITATP